MINYNYIRNMYTVKGRVKQMQENTIGMNNNHLHTVRTTMKKTIVIINDTVITHKNHSYMLANRI